MYGLNDLRDSLDLPADAFESDCTSVGGWITELFGHIPAVNEKTEGSWFAITVTDATEQKINRVRLAVKEPASADV